VNKGEKQKGQVEKEAGYNTEGKGYIYKTETAIKKRLQSGVGDRVEISEEVETVLLSLLSPSSDAL
jgi:hypothetical protein